MAIAKPRHVPQGTCSRMVSILKARDRREMQRLLRVEEILVEQNGVEQFDKKKHAELWNTFCVTWLTQGQPSEDGSRRADPKTNCTCWLNCAKGHCIHRYIASEWFGYPLSQPSVPELRGDLTKSVPGAGAYSSEEEDNPRRRASQNRGT